MARRRGALAAAPARASLSAEPVTLGSVHHPLRSAWRPPARGLTFPEVQSHSASRYSPLTSQAASSPAPADLIRGQEERPLSHKSLIFPAGGAEIPRCLQTMGRGVNHAFGSARRPRCRSGVRSVARAGGGRGGRLMEGKGIALTAPWCQRSDCPKPNFTADFLGRCGGE